MDLVQRFIQRYGRLPTEFDRDYLEMLRMSKYRILAVPTVQPGKCANCGSSKNDGRKYIDFDLQVDWYGVVYLCSLCLTDICSHMGLFNALREEIAKLQNEILKVSVDTTKADRVRNDFLRTFREVQDYFNSLPATGSSTSPDSSSVDGIKQEAAPESGIADDESATNAAKPKPAKSTPSSGSKNVSSLAELIARE